MTVNAAYELFHSFYSEKFVKITQCTEVLKIRGLPANEASRIRQWEQLAGESVEHLRMLKMYRTPQALRSFARIFSLLLPPFYAPAFAQLSHDTGSLALGVAFAVIISLALTGKHIMNYAIVNLTCLTLLPSVAIFNSVLILEDPFVGHITLDGIGKSGVQYHALFRPINFFCLLTYRIGRCSRRTSSSSLGSANRSKEFHIP